MLGVLICCRLLCWWQKPKEVSRWRVNYLSCSPFLSSLSLSVYLSLSVSFCLSLFLSVSLSLSSLTISNYVFDLCRTLSSYLKFVNFCLLYLFLLFILLCTYITLVLLFTPSVHLSLYLPGALSLFLSLSQPYLTISHYVFDLCRTLLSYLQLHLFFGLSLLLSLSISLSFYCIYIYIYRLLYIYISLFLLYIYIYTDFYIYIYISLSLVLSPCFFLIFPSLMFDNPFSDSILQF